MKYINERPLAVVSVSKASCFENFVDCEGVGLSRKIYFRSIVVVLFFSRF